VQILNAFVDEEHFVSITRTSRTRTNGQVRELRFLELLARDFVGWVQEGGWVLVRV